MFKFFTNLLSTPKKSKGRKANTKVLKELSVLNSKQIPKYRKRQLKSSGIKG